MESISSWNPSLLVRQNRPILDLWVPGRTDGHIFEKTIFQNTFPETKPIKKGVGKNIRAFCLSRTESIPDLNTILVCPSWDDTGGKHRRNWPIQELWQNRLILGLWVPGRTDTFLKKLFSKTPSHKWNPSKKGLKKTLAPSALAVRNQFLLCLVNPRWDDTAGNMTVVDSTRK